MNAAATSDLSSAVTFRSAGPADMPALIDLARRTFIDTFAPYNSPANLQHYIDQHYAPEKLSADFSNPAATVLLAEIAGTAVAYARLTTGNVPGCVGDPGALRIDKFYVDKPYLGRGIAAEMMKHCLRLAAEQGRRTIYLGVWEHNDRAVRFYTKWDFVRCGEHLCPVGEDPQTDWWMRRAVAPQP